MASTNVQNDRGGQNRPDGEKGQFSSAAGTADASVGQNNKHQPGKLVGNDAVEEFSAQTLPPGSAPSSRTFQPNPVDQTPANGASDETANASDTITGATSADVHTGLGHPGSGQSSKELRHDGQATNSQPGSSLEGLKSTKQGDLDPRDPDMAGQRALDVDGAVTGSDVAAAQEKEPVQASQLQSERP